MSGTAKQAVADDYALRLSKAISKNNDELYSKLIDRQVYHMTNGAVSSEEWKMCDKTNATYLDCPIKNYDLQEGSDVFISVHNPSSLMQSVAQISVPHGKFIVQEFKNGEYTDAEAVDVMCYKDTDAAGVEI